MTLQSKEELIEWIQRDPLVALEAPPVEEKTLTSMLELAENAVDLSDFKNKLTALIQERAAIWEEVYEYAP